MSTAKQEKIQQQQLTQFNAAIGVVRKKEDMLAINRRYVRSHPPLWASESFESNSWPRDAGHLKGEQLTSY